jgi:hypothetical protein
MSNSTTGQPDNRITDHKSYGWLPVLPSPGLHALLSRYGPRLPKMRTPLVRRTSVQSEPFDRVHRHTYRAAAGASVLARYRTMPTLNRPEASWWSTENLSQNYLLLSIRMIRLTGEQWERIRKHFPGEHIPDGRQALKMLSRKFG